MRTNDKTIVKQDSPDNVLWQLFRIEVEKEVIPETLLYKTKRFIQCLDLQKSKNKGEGLDG